jgi:hypothetical protein
MSKILNLKQYDLIFTTSFFYKHGVSGHMYEMIDYYTVCKTAGINCAILLADGTTTEEFQRAVFDKYDFDEVEKEELKRNTIECHQPKIIMANNICLVDGSWRVLSCTIYADNAFLLRCSEPDFTYWANSKSVKRSHIMQDFKLYPERFEHLNIECVNYVKKILWDRYRKPNLTTTNTAMLYLTTNCRAIDVEQVKTIINSGKYDNYLILSNDPTIYKSLESANVTVEQAPIKNIFERFDTYIYTATELQSDCSPRFIVECALYGKSIDYQIDYVCKGVERRKEDIAEDVDQLRLTVDDFFVSYVKQQYEKTS